MAGVDQAFYELFDCVAALRGRDSAHLFLDAAVARYGLRHIAYGGVNKSDPKSDFFCLKCTYPDSWVDHYLSNDYAVVDPAVRNAFISLAPFDWDDLSKNNPTERAFFGESVEFGLGRKGITFPVRGLRNDLGIFSINSDANDSDWGRTKGLLIRDFQILATYFHEGIVGAAGFRQPKVEARLSPREIECLKWAADGKTAWETSHILRISERSVRFHLDGARRKLNCVTKVQAVAKAVAFGLIVPS